MAGEAEQLRAYLEYFRDLGVYDLYRRGEPVYELEVFSAAPQLAEVVSAEPSRAVVQKTELPPAAETVSKPTPPSISLRREFSEPEISKLVSFDNLAPLPEVRLSPAEKPAALEAIREDIGDCTRCPLAYAGRHKIVFADGDPNARLMFVGEGPGADEDIQGLPFVGKAGQLLNNMINAMGLKREQVYIANIVKCRPPGNRVPEPVEANTCTQFLLRQVDIVQPEVIVALGSTAATYLLGAKQSLSGLRGRWHGCRGAKLAVTYHPAFLLRDPRQKGEAWKDLQMVMKELGLKPPAKG
ncbi:uracil-DNA glycosylase [Edaphobacter albus]|uniref:uracil-DNA glycosylase n=1 Tax=Edaphobacter sp. 4G125 TaxID=2763071 RepID=UPI0016475AE4|nr:uracil-DNA glycosylase [Edaphobacter sp. 4G125]QNI36092.1 uracil-DNA glycosylase [Edaphobacter sp. 4G125]